MTQAQGQPGQVRHRQQGRTSATPCVPSACSRIGDVSSHEDRPEIRGMIAKVTHLVTVEEVD